MATTDFSGGAAARRLPIYLLLDTSGSMAGAPIEAVNRGVELIHRELMNDPSAIETVYISVITFASDAQQVFPLTELMAFKPPTLNAGGSTSLGQALHMLAEDLDRSIRPNTATQKGDYKPLIFLLTDGMPTDTWEREADAIKNRAQKKVANIIALGCGGGVDQAMLKRITDNVLMMDSTNADQISQFFKWVSQSIKTASVSAEKAGGGDAVAPLPTPPKEFMVVV